MTVNLFLNVQVFACLGWIIAIIFTFLYFGSMIVNKYDESGGEGWMALLVLWGTSSFGAVLALSILMFDALFTGVAW